MLRYGDTHRKEDVWAAIEAHQAQLHPLHKAAMLTTIELYPTGLKEIKGWLAGGDLNEIKAYEPIVADWAKSIGCHRAALAGRRGWLRELKSYHDGGTVLVKELI